MDRSRVIVDTEVLIYDHYSPWLEPRREYSGGWGCVVAPGLVLTCAHVVANATRIQVRLPERAGAFAADVFRRSDDADLALLRVASTAFESVTVPVEFDSNVPSPGTPLRVWGGRGEDDAPLEVVLRRFDLQAYTHSMRALPAIAISPKCSAGSSGAPAELNGKIVGINLQGSADGEMSWLVPTHLIERFLDSDVPDHALPELGIVSQRTEPHDLRRFLGLDGHAGGVLVSAVHYGSTLDGFLREGDVLLSIDNRPVSRDGFMPSPFRWTEQIHYTHYISTLDVGTTADIGFLRNGHIGHVSAILKEYVSLIPAVPNGPPSYYMFGGLVFCRLTYSYLALWDWNDVSFRYKSLVYDGVRSPQRQEVVIVLRCLPHLANEGYQRMFGMVVSSVNEHVIQDLHSLACRVDAIHDGFVTFRVENLAPRTESPFSQSEFGNLIVLDISRAREATQDILGSLGMTADRSASLAAKQRH
jgi:hypothetical protein